MAQTLGEIQQSVTTRRANALAALLDQLTGAINSGQSFTTTQGQATATLGSSAAIFMSFLDGSFMIPNVDFTVSGNVYTFTNPSSVQAGQTLYVIQLGAVLP